MISPPTTPELCKLWLTIFLTSTIWSGDAAAEIPGRVLVPVIDGEWTQIAGNPDLGKYTTEKQQPVDFAVWQAANSKWQLWSCIRRTDCGGNTRLFHRWESDELTAPDWKPIGIAMMADSRLGEREGGLQAPHVVEHNGKYHMFYGDWEHICHAVSDDGVTFERVVQPNGKTGLFAERKNANTRDIMMLDIDGVWHGYYTAHPNNQGAVFVRTTTDFKSWGPSVNASYGGEAGTNAFGSECPFVVERDGRFYLFRTQKYGPESITRVYVSDDPKMFGINQDHRHLVTSLPVGAPEIVTHEGQDYIVATNLDLKGLRIAKLKWVEQKP